MCSSLVKTAAAALSLVLVLGLTGCSDGGPAAPEPESHDILLPLKPVLAAALREQPPPEPGESYIPRLQISREFSVTRPVENITTTLESYFITGTSDPESPVYLEDEELERQGSKGLFGVHVELAPGENVFGFSQDGELATVGILREEPQPAELTVIRQDSMVPRVFAGAKAGGVLELGCIAPAGASVEAVFAGVTVALEQESGTEEDGVPAFYTGKLNVPAILFDETATENAGKVRYNLLYGEEESEYESTGDVYVSGQSSRFAVRVENFMAFCYPDNTFGDLPGSSEKLKRGAVDYVISEGNGYVELSSGGFVNKDAVKPLTGAVSVTNRLMAARSVAGGESESYIFLGSAKPAYKTELTETGFSFTLYNTMGEESPAPVENGIFSDIGFISAGNVINYTFDLEEGLGPGDIWGYTVNYSGRATVLTFYYRPKASSLEGLDGLVIVLDPGHGGSEPGALGVAGTRGPAEKDINLAHAFALRQKLEDAGATVLLTREDDSYVSLDERLKFPEDAEADLFVSIHHNSVGVDMDANGISGVEVYYHSPMSRALAESFFSGLTEPLSRGARFVEESYYRVTLNPRCPAVLLELGFMSNPLEYENAVETAEILDFASAAASSLERLFQ